MRKAALRVGDRVFYEGTTWCVTSLGRHTLHRRGDATITYGELYAILLLEADPAEGQPPHKIVLPESKWDEVRLLEGGKPRG